MQRLPAFVRLLVPMLLVTALGGAAWASVGYTNQPAFCSSCHEMTPYQQAWTHGPHEGVSCIECHVDPGTVARVSHKAVALKEVWSHFTKAQAFPLDEPTAVPDARCIACHDKIDAGVGGFDHVSHAEKGRCVDCHATTGHRVTEAALERAGILNEGQAASNESSGVASVGNGSANITGHKPVSCSQCHDMARTGCESCHTPRHEGAAKKTAGCTTCHAPGESFVFAHPAAVAACASCHEPPAEHSKGECSTCHPQNDQWTFTHPVDRATCAGCHDRPAKHRAGECSKCHTQTTRWAFTHPAKSSACTSCHGRPAGHRAGACPTCHKTGVSWAYRHPRAGANCASCHARPSGHRSGSCTKCHKAAKSWAFRHPSSGCTRCHNRPSNHSSSSCQTCHRSSSWAFRHPGSSSCASCHRAPSSHYGSSCRSCHSPSRSWRSATFSHPRIPGGEHSYRSFACSNCHPSGYGSHTCARCHDSASGPREDDDDD